MIPQRLPQLSMVALVVALFGNFAPALAQSPAPGWTWRSVAAAPGPLRVLIIYDMEGLSGVDRHAMTTCEDPEAYAAGVDRLVMDVNAVVEGLLAAGVTKIEAIDRHGSGCDDQPDLPAARLHPRASHVDEQSASLITRVMRREWDAVLLVGGHTSPGWNGFLEHVGSFGIERIINGVSVSESEQTALYAGLSGTPVIFASGDDRFGAQIAARLPWVSYVEVKRATSRSSAMLRPAEQARADLIAGARAAVERRHAAKIVALEAPFTGAYKPVWPYTLEPLKALPGFDLSEGLIRVSGATPREVNDAINAISVLVAGIHTAAAHWESLRTDPKRDRFRDVAFMREWHAGPP